MTGLLHIVLARKPLEGTVAENCLQWGCGAINIDGTRIAGDEDGSRNRPPSVLGSTTTYAQDKWTRTAIVQRQDTTGFGRWPANLILGHCESCTCKGTKKVKGSFLDHDCQAGKIFSAEAGTGGLGITRKHGHTDAEGMETIEEWQCEKDCVVSIIGEQSGVKTSGKSKKVHKEYGDAFKFGGGLSTPENQHGDTGTAARFFFNYTEQESDE